MTISVLDLLKSAENGDYPDIPQFTTQAQLLDVHRQLLDASARGHQFLEAAALVSRASNALKDAETDETRAHVPVIVRQVIEDLRA